MESFVRKQYCPELARMLGLIDFACQKRASLKKKNPPPSKMNVLMRGL